MVVHIHSALSHGRGYQSIETCINEVVIHTLCYLIQCFGRPLAHVTLCNILFPTHILSSDSENDSCIHQSNCRSSCLILSFASCYLFEAILGMNLVVRTATAASRACGCSLFLHFVRNLFLDVCRLWLASRHPLLEIHEALHLNPVQLDEFSFSRNTKLVQLKCCTAPFMLFQSW